MPLRLGQGCEHIGERILEQVGERGERERRLRDHRPGSQHPVAALAGASDDRMPQRRLADARLALDKRHGWQGGTLVQEFEYRGQFAVAAEELLGGRHGSRLWCTGAPPHVDGAFCGDFTDCQRAPAGVSYAQSGLAHHAFARGIDP